VTSEAKSKANRANARASTGPKSAQGRAHAARNALRHALSLPVFSNPSLSEAVETLARKVAGPDATQEIQMLARQIAEAQIDVLRVRRARQLFLSVSLSQPHHYYDSRADTRDKVAVIRYLLRPNAPDISLAALTRYLTAMPEGAQKFAIVLLNEANQLQTFDRYERRALSRRKFAIRAFDQMRREFRSTAILDCERLDLAERSQKA
jgi:hypothetical protein